LSCVAIDTLTDATQLSLTIVGGSEVTDTSELDATDPVEQRISLQPISMKQVSRVFVDLLLAQHSLLTD